jgi:hypothetical protein
MKNSDSIKKYTCNEYREEMILLGLQTRLSSQNLSREEKKNLIKEIARIEKKMGIA